MEGVAKLVIAPHVDDEVLGCGGILDADSFVYYCGIDESKLPPDPGHRIPIEERWTELQQCSEFLGFRYECNRDSRVNYYDEHEFIGPFEALINRLKPEKVFIPHPGYNQDHRAAYYAAYVALRPHDRNFFVKKVLVYEAAHDVLWSPAPLQVNYFVPIDIERKLAAYRLHASQVRGMRSPDLLRSIAQVRGQTAGVPWAEAFSILRWCE